MGRLLTLKCVHPSRAPAGVKLEAKVGLDASTLAIDFQVHTPRIHFNPEWPLDHSRWGLWDQGDVIELFLATGDIVKDGYFEFQVSPRNQFFTLHILEPRKRHDEKRPMPFVHTSHWDERHGLWTAKLEIPLGDYGWQGDQDSIRGGLFAMLGESGSRTYWSAFLPPQEKPDFHLPGHFQRLIS